MQGCFEYSSFEYKYEYEYFKFVLELYSSTSTSTEYYISGYMGWWFGLAVTRWS